MIQRPQDGILLVYKPVGPTSHDMVLLVRHLSKEKKVGHAGSLDPFAEGLLVILVGKQATKRQTEFLLLDKTYEATIRLGAHSTTDDSTGKIVYQSTAQPVEPLKVKHVVETFIGTQMQIPPQYSAKKIKGKKAYEFARKGEAVQLKPKEINIISIEILDYQWPNLKIRALVSSGTYIRALARDIGEKLGCKAYCEKLLRSQIGPYRIEQAMIVSDTGKAPS